MIASKYLLLHKDKHVICPASSIFCFDIDSYCLELFNHIANNFSLKRTEKCKKTLISQLNSYMAKFNLIPTDKQSRLINELKSDGYIVLYPYQPNLFPSTAVFAPFLHLSQIREKMQLEYNIKIVPIFLIIDYDNVMDKRFSRFYLPYSLNKMGHLNYHYQIPKDFKNDIMRAVPLNSNVFIEWLSSIKNLILPDIKAIYGESGVDEHFEFLETRISNVLASVKTFADFNVLFLYKLLVEDLDLPIIFIEGNYLYNKDSNILESVIEKKREIVECVKDLPGIVGKNGISFPKDNLAKIYIWKYQSKCRSRCNANVGCYSNCKYENRFPNVLMDYIIDYTYYNKCGAVGYYKQAEMTLISDWIVDKIFGIAPCPQLLSYARPVLNQYQEEILKRFKSNNNNYYTSLKDPHCSILFFILLWGIDGLYKQINESKIFLEG